MADSSEKLDTTPRPTVEEPSREELAKQVQRQLTLLKKVKDKCDDLNQKCEAKDATIEDLFAQRRRWQVDHAELQELRKAYESLQEVHEKKCKSFEALEEELAATNHNLVTWRHKYQEVFDSLECMQSKMATLNLGTECLRQELRSLEEKNKVANSTIDQLTKSHAQLLAERVLMRQHTFDQDKSQEPAGSDSALSPSHTTAKMEEFCAQCSTQEPEMCNSAWEATAQEAESANEEAALLRKKIFILLAERSSLENQRDEKINECNLLQEEKHGLEKQLSDLYQTKEDGEAREKEFAKILDENSSLEKLLAEAVNESTKLQENINKLQENIRVAEAEKLQLVKELEMLKDLEFRETIRLKDIIKSLEEKLAVQTEQNQDAEHEPKVSICCQIESEKLVENLKPTVSPLQQQVDNISTTAEIFTPDNQMAMENRKDAIEREGKSAAKIIKDLEEALKKVQTEKAGLEDEIAKIKKADQLLFEEFQISIGKVSLLEKDLNRSIDEKQDIVDELCQVKDLQRFLEDEGTELRQECKRLKAQAGRLEADLDNDRLHIRKLEHELEAAECREQQSLREAEMFRQELKEMALLASKYEKALQECVSGDMEPEVIWDGFHRFCEIILEAAEKKFGDIQSEALLPGKEAILVLSDFGDDSGAAGENGKENRENAVSAKTHQQLRRALGNVNEELKTAIRGPNVLQLEKHALKQELSLEKNRRTCLDKELTAATRKIYFLEERMTELEQKRRELDEKNEVLSNALDQITKIRADFENLEQANEVHSRFSPELCMSGSSGEEPSPQYLGKKNVELIARLSYLELDLMRANRQMSTKAQNEAQASASEQSETEGFGRGGERNTLVLGDRGCDDVDIRQHCSDMEIEKDKEDYFYRCRSSGASLLKSSETQMQERDSGEVLMFKAELKSKSKPLDQRHSKIDDLLKQGDELEELVARNKQFEDYESDVLKEDSASTSVTAQLIELKDRLLFYETEFARLRAVFEPEFTDQATTQKDMLCQLYSAHRSTLNVLSQLISHTTRQYPQVLADGSNDLNVLLEAERLHAALSEKLDSISFEEESSSSLSCVVVRAVCRDLATELSLIKSFEKMLEILSIGEGKLQLSEHQITHEVKRQDSHKEIDSQEKPFQKEDENVSTLKELVIRLKDELAIKTTQVNVLEEELSSIKQKLVMKAKVSEQSIENVQNTVSGYWTLAISEGMYCFRLQQKKESQVRKLLDLEIADLERTVAELSRLLKEKNQQLYIIQEESLAQQSTITCLSEKISSLEKQKQAVDEQLLAYEEIVANLEEEMLKSQKCEEELQKSKVRLESEVKAGQLREEDLKVRAHSVLKQQKQNAAGANTSETSDVESEIVIENMKRQIDYLEKQLQMERDATKTARDDCEVMAQKHQHVLLEQKKEWRNRLDEVKQNAKDMAKELRKQLDLQHEKLSAEYQKKLEEKDAEYGQTIEKLKNELGEVQKMSAQAPTAPLQEMAAAGGDFSTLERQAGEGSESVTPPQQPLHQQLPWELVPATGATPLEILLEPPASVEARSQKTVSHLAELLNESECNNLRMTEQIRVLKEEIRRHERNYERQKHAVNLEYLKNIIMKFVTLRGGSEKERLVPVLTTMLKLSPDEKKDLEAVVTKEMQQDAAGASNWGGYLPRWTGFVG
ncbi:uncharacterized protein LOC119185247 isoform X6 [Rhipicephalus microplus]|uniref:uncharacterized protein LOC119185247 isoform X6 n=1 Tax=Rhipicephalus microplus TaxID=6941 RepID=UPI003F6BADD7